MAPRPIHEPPHVQLSRLALGARRRGLDFETFWWEAVREGRALVMTNHPDPPAAAVRWPTDRTDRHAWQGAIYGSREGWRRAYERMEAPVCERALAMLGEAFAMLDRVAESLIKGGEDDEDGLGPQSALPSAA